jgi:hypothetical protein
MPVGQHVSEISAIVSALLLNIYGSTGCRRPSASERNKFLMNTPLPGSPGTLLFLKEMY